jgi:hypothetical protein
LLQQSCDEVREKNRSKTRRKSWEPFFALTKFNDKKNDAILKAE